MTADDLVERIANVNERFDGAFVQRLEVKFMHHLALELSMNVATGNGRSLRHVVLTFQNLESVSTRIAAVAGVYTFAGLQVLQAGPLLEARPVRTASDGTQVIVPPARHFRLRTDAGECDFLAADFTCCELFSSESRQGDA